MPELPEAETIVRGLRPTVVGEVITRIEIPHADVLRAHPRPFRAQVRGRRITAVERRGKNVLLMLDSRDVVAVNLGMTGRLLPFATPPRGSAAPTHPAVRFRFASGGVLVFNDPRRFGTVECLSAEAWHRRSSAMGPEPLSRAFTARRLHRALSASRSPTRSWLLDQKRVAGVGNIYANEALHLAGIHPRRPARTVSEREAEALHQSLRGVLRRAVAAGGTTLRDYRDAGGRAGHYAPRLHVYGREGQPCLTCGRPIQRTVFSNRSAFLCPGCQPWREDES